MKKSISQSILKKILSQPDSVSCDGLFDALTDELERPDGKADPGYIESCLDALLAARGIAVAPYTPVLPAELLAPQPQAPAPRIRIMPRIAKFAVAACITFAVLFFVNTVSTYAFNFNIAAEIASWSKDKVSLKLAPEASYEADAKTVFASIQSQLTSQGLLHVQWPDYLPEKMELDTLLANDSETSTDVTICLSGKQDSLSVSITEYKDMQYLEDNLVIDILGYYTDGEQLTVNGRTVYYIANKNVGIMCYADNLSRYVITSTYDRETMLHIVESMF